jgi:hypothetical protein
MDSKKRKYPSGAEKKRTTKVKKREELAEHVKKITNYLCVPEPSTSEPSTSSPIDPNPTPSTIISLLIDTDSDSENDSVQLHAVNSSNQNISNQHQTFDLTSESEPESEHNHPLIVLNDDVQRSSEPLIEYAGDGEDYFTKPARNALSIFLKHHPQQPDAHIPFNPKKVYCNVDGNIRKWISYNTNTKKLYCYLCLAFSNNVNGTFVKGFSDFKHVCNNISIHEKSKDHEKCVNSLLILSSGKDINTLLNRDAKSLRNRQIFERRELLKRIIDVVKLIGKRGLSYRGHRNESSFTLNSLELDHGNFLEMILLLGKYDPVMQQHLDNIKKENESGKNSKGRGNKITFLSKSTIDYIINIIGNEIQNIIASEVRQAKFYTVQIDTTQDVSTKDQLSLVFRYILNGIAHEKLLSMTPASSSTGKKV